MTKVDIFSGFLGAGKTTLIRKLIGEAYAGEQLVLIENEFGEIGVDGAFLAEAGIRITEMNSGCICCSLVGDFGRALKQVIDTYAPTRILIEPSGVGKLSDVIRAVRGVDSDQIELNSFTTVVDARKCRMYMKNFGEFFDNQVENASALILSHTAGMDAAKLAECVALLREKNPDAAIVTTDWDAVSGAQILETMEKRSTLEAELARLEQEARDGDDDDECDDPECECHHHHDEDGEEHHHHHHHDGDDDDECDDPECECHHHHDEDGEEHHHHHHHHHDGDDDDECDDPECECHHHHDEDGEEHHHHHHHHHHHADEVFVSWGRETARVYSADEIERILTALENESEYGIVLRAKGVVDGGNGWIHFDYVPGTPDVRAGAASVTGRICVIGSKLHEDALAALFGVQ